MPAPEALPLSILLLAGGRGQRMGNADKGLLDWRGRPLIATLHDKVRPLTDDLIISCNRNLDRYRPYADQLVTDPEPDYPGPMAGIRAGLAAARHAWLMVLPCDCPLADRDLLRLMIERTCSTGQPVMARQGGQWEPLFCILPTACREAFDAAFAAGERSPRKVMLQLGTVALELPADDPRLTNMNTPEALEAALGNFVTARSSDGK